MEEEFPLERLNKLNKECFLPFPAALGEENPALGLELRDDPPVGERMVSSSDSFIRKRIQHCVSAEG